MKIDRTEIDAPPTGICQLSGKICGADRSPVPARIWATFCRMNDMPIAVISGASRGALRSGR